MHASDRSRQPFQRQVKLPRVRSADPTSLDDLNQKHHQGEDKQDMDESSHCVGTDESERPEDKKNDGDCVEHNFEVWRVLVSVRNAPGTQ